MFFEFVCLFVCLIICSFAFLFFFFFFFLFCFVFFIWGSDGVGSGMTDIDGIREQMGEIKPRLNDQTFSSNIVLDEHVLLFSHLSQLCI